MLLWRSGIVAAALTAQLALAPQVAAQDASTLKKDMIGQWELATTERSKTCVVTLKGDTTPQGLKLELEPGCPKALPFTKDITAWNIKGLDIVRTINTRAVYADKKDEATFNRLQQPVLIRNVTIHVE